MEKRILTFLPIFILVISIACKFPFPGNEPPQENEIQTPPVEITQKQTDKTTNGGDLKIVWSAEYFSEPQNNLIPYVYLNGDKIYFETNEGTIQSREISSGRVLWEFSPSARVMGVDESHVYIKPNPLRIDVLDIKNGDFLNRILINIPGGNISYPLITSKKNFLVPFTYTISDLGPYAGYIIVDKNNGSIVSTSNTPYHRSVYHKDDIYVIRSGEFIRGISLESGEVIWELIFGQDLQNALDIVECRDILYIVDYVNRPQELIALNPINGNILWKIRDDLFSTNLYCHQDTIFGFSNLNGSSMPTIENGHETIYLSANASDNTPLFYAIDRLSGNILWSGNDYTSPFGPPEPNGPYLFLGTTSNLVFYSHEDFGLTQAYSIYEHKLVWENPNVIFDKLIGVVGDKLIGISSSSTTSIITGLDINTGEILWQKEISDIERLVFIENNFLFIWVPSNLHFLDPETGTINTSIPIERWLSDVVAYQDGLLITHTSIGEPRSVSYIRP